MNKVMNANQPHGDISSLIKIIAVCSIWSIAVVVTIRFEHKMVGLAMGAIAIVLTAMVLRRKN